MTTCVALLRGINVGRANRIAMAELRQIMKALGYADVKTLLNSGNVIFNAARHKPEKVATAIESAITATLGLVVPVVVVPAAEIRRVVAGNPLGDVAHDPSRRLVGFFSGPNDLAAIGQFVGTDWGEDAIAVDGKIAYLWCANGVLDSKLYKEFSRVTGKSVTTRNWATVLKLHSMMSPPDAD